MNFRLLAACCALLAVSCSRPKDDTATAEKLADVQKQLAQIQRDAFKPGLGEIMLMNQIRHAKLWFAGENGNWDLAKYELDEIKEGLADAAKYNPVHEDAPKPLTELIPRFMNVPVQRLEQAIANKDAEKFASAFDTLSASCNGCHQAAEHRFNVIKRPAAPPLSNQDFTPLKGIAPD